jgi:hypothetical protein
MINPGVYPKPIPFGGMGKPVKQNGFFDHSPITMRVTEVDRSAAYGRPPRRPGLKLGRRDSWWLKRPDDQDHLRVVVRLDELDDQAVGLRDLTEGQFDGR